MSAMQVNLDNHTLPALTLCEESLRLSQELGDLWGTAWSLDVLGHVAQRQGHTERASALLGESLPLAWQRGDRAGIAWCLEGLASVVGCKDSTAARRGRGASPGL